MPPKPVLRENSTTFVLLTLLIGVGIGVLTLLLQKLLPDSLIQFANSGAVWSVLAFIVGKLALSWRTAVVVGFLGLSGEVVGYYTFAYFADLFEVSGATLAVVGYWLLIALIAGATFGWAGHVSSHSQGMMQKIGIASLGAIFMGEGLYLISILPQPTTGLLWLGIAAALTLYGMWKHRQRIQFLIVSAVLGMLFFIAESSLVLLGLSTGCTICRVNKHHIS